MNLCKSKLESYEDILLSETTHITTVKEILDSLMAIGEIYSEQTARTKLDSFKKCMYYCSFASNNPMYLFMAQNILHVSDERIYVHELMYKFLCNKHQFMKFAIFEDVSSKYDPTSFLWDIPEIFMPILTSYILATASSKEESSTITFFSKMDEYFNSPLNTYNESTKGIYEKWTNNYLGREYFFHLENIYNTYAKTSQQQTIIKDSFFSLTKILIDAPVPPDTIPAQMCSLLIHNETNLKKHTDFDSLYPHDEPWEMEFESKLIDSIISTMLQIPNELFSFLETSLDSNSRYKIAVNNFDLFKEKFDSYIKDINSQIEKSKEETVTSYFGIRNDPDIILAIEEKHLIFNESNFNKRIEFLNTAISNYEDELMKKITSFISKVERASDTKKSSSLHLSKDYFKDFKADINYRKTLFEKKLNNFNKLPPFLFIHKDGYIKENLSYPLYFFYENDILRLTCELTHNYYYLSKEHILNHFKNRGLVFPVLRSNLILFLLNFDQMIEGL